MSGKAIPVSITGRLPATGSFCGRIVKALVPPHPLFDLPNALGAFGQFGLVHGVLHRVKGVFYLGGENVVERGRQYPLDPWPDRICPDRVPTGSSPPGATRLYALGPFGGGTAGCAASAAGSSRMIF